MFVTNAEKWLPPWCLPLPASYPRFRLLWAATNDPGREDRYFDEYLSFLRSAPRAAQLRIHVCDAANHVFVAVWSEGRWSEAFIPFDAVDNWKEFPSG